MAELLILVDMVLMPAAKTDAMSKPVIPTGRLFTINKGNTLSDCIPSGKSPGLAEK